ncbi:MAG: TRAP transporter large permease subunit [Dehalococcoidia bacterium]
MEQWLVALIMVVGLVTVLATGLPIAFSLGFMSVVLLLLTEGWGGLDAIFYQAYGISTSFVLVAVPLFILMGNLIYHSGVGREIYDLASKWLGWMPGGLATATVGACGIFGAMSGSALAGSATIGVVAIPEMQNKGYRRDLSLGSVAAAGGLAALIPPSVVMILYGDISDNSIGKLFIAGILPGILVIIIFSLYHLWVGLRYPEAAPREPGVPWGDRFRVLGRLWAPVLLITFVIGSIYTGIATPTESAGVGALGAFLILTMKHRGFRPNLVRNSIHDAVMVTGYMLLILVGALTFAYVATLAYIPQSLTAWMVSLPVDRWLILAMVWVFLILMGMFFDGVSLIVLTTPLVYPVIIGLGWDPIWYGVILVLNVEIGAITPPVGLHFYVVKGLTPNTPMIDVIRGCFPYVILFHVAVVIIAVMPWIATWLPSTMMK